VTAQDLDFQGDTGGALSIDLDSETLTIAGGTGLDTVGSGNTVTVAIDSTVATLTGTQTLTNKTLTSPVINTGVSGTAVLDDDTFATATATTLATSESIKAYVDTTVAATNEVVEDTTPQLGGDLDLNSSDITGTGNINITGTITSSGNITGTLATAAQPNITSVGTLTGLTTTGDINFGDNDKAVFGAGSDLQIYHDGSASYIDDAGTGNLRIRANSSLSIQKYTGETMGVFTADGSVLLAHDNSTKLETTSTGIDVTGTVTADGLDVSTLSGDATIFLQNVSSGRGMKITKNYDDFSAKFFYSLHPTTEAGSLAFKGSQDSTQLLINSNGDISFYEDTGTTAKLFWDASTESLGIGTTSPAQKLHVYGNSGTTALAVGDNGLVEPYGLLEADATNNVFSVHSRANYPITFKIANTEHMRIDSSGNVGIGTSSPNAIFKLDVEGAVRTNGTGLFVSENYSSGNDVYKIYDNSNEFRIESQIFGNANTASSPIVFATSNTDGRLARMTITSSGNVGIGTDSPSAMLHVSGTGNRNIAVESTNTGSGANAAIKILAADGGDFLWQTGNATGNALRLYDLNANQERLRIDSSGNLLVGTTNNAVYASSSESGLVYRADFGLLGVSRQNNYSGSFNRYGTDGDIVNFRKDGTTVGSIGIESTGFYMDGEAGHTGIRFGAAQICPRDNGADTDGLTDLGFNGGSFRDLYLSGGVYVGGTAAANKLDDYETGSFTPTIAAPGQTVTYTQQFGRYIKVGDLVHVQCRVTIDTVSGGSGTLYFGNLPFTADSGLYYNSVLSVVRMAYFNTNISSELQNIMIIQGATHGFLYYSGNTTGNISALAYTDIKAGSTITYSGTYKVN
jgi:hypothetical protein